MEEKLAEMEMWKMHLEWFAHTEEQVDNAMAQIGMLMMEIDLLHEGGAR